MHIICVYAVIALLPSFKSKSTTDTPEEEHPKGMLLSFADAGRGQVSERVRRCCSKCLNSKTTDTCL